MSASVREGNPLVKLRNSAWLRLRSAAVAFALGETVELQDHVDAVGHHQRLDPAAQAAERERHHRRPQSLPM